MYSNSLQIFDALLLTFYSKSNYYSSHRYEQQRPYYNIVSRILKINQIILRSINQNRENLLLLINIDDTSGLERIQSKWKVLWEKKIFQADFWEVFRTSYRKLTFGF